MRAGRAGWEDLKVEGGGHLHHIHSGVGREVLDERARLDGVEEVVDVIVEMNVEQQI